MISMALSLIAIAFYFFVLYKAFDKLVTYLKGKYIKARLEELLAFLEESKDNLQDYSENSAFSHSELFNNILDEILSLLNLILTSSDTLYLNPTISNIDCLLKLNESDCIRDDLKDVINTLNDIKDLTK